MLLPQQSYPGQLCHWSAAGCNVFRPEHEKIVQVTLNWASTTVLINIIKLYTIFVMEAFMWTAFSCALFNFLDNGYKCVFLFPVNMTCVRFPNINLRSLKLHWLASLAPCHEFWPGPWCFTTKVNTSIRPWGLSSKVNNHLNMGGPVTTSMSVVLPKLLIAWSSERSWDLCWESVDPEFEANVWVNFYS